MLYVINDFSINMLNPPSGATIQNLKLRAVTPEEAAELLRVADSEELLKIAIPNYVIADEFLDQMEGLGVSLPDPARHWVQLGTGDAALWVSYKGPRYTNTFPPEGQLHYYLMRPEFA